MNVVESRDSQVGKECREEESRGGCDDCERRRCLLREVEVKRQDRRKGDVK